ncbi:MAG: hypothetical protein RLZZ585_280 [Bacteroidota bacterium]|jgi:hypothetical protein
MKNINEITKQLDLLYTEQKLQEKEVFEKMESILVNASPMNIISKTIENIISKNNLDQELPKLTIRFLINNLSERFFSKSPILKDTVQTVVGDFLTSSIFEKKSENPIQFNPTKAIAEKTQIQVEH